MWLISFVLFVGASGDPAIQATPTPLQIAASLYGAFHTPPKTGPFWVLRWRLFCPPDLELLCPTQKGRAGRVAGPQGRVAFGDGRCASTLDRLRPARLRAPHGA
jgi:hypothetical protein